MKGKIGYPHDTHHVVKGREQKVLCMLRLLLSTVAKRVGYGFHCGEKQRGG